MTRRGATRTECVATSLSCIGLSVSFLAAAACAGPEPPSGFVETTVDGAREVRSLRPAWSPGDGWRVDPEPLVSIGVEAGDDAYQLYSPSAALLLEDGSVVVSDPGKSEISLFDPQGRFVRSAGARGQGPGEFSQFGIMWMWLDGTDRIVVDDTPGGRANVFDGSGELAEVVLIEPTPQGRRANLVGTLGDGTWVAVAREDDGPPGGDAGDVIQPPLRYVRYRNGAPVNEIATAEYRPRYVHDWGDEVDYPFLPFGRAPLEAAAAGKLYLVPDGEPRVLVFDSDGTARARFILEMEETRRVVDVYQRWCEAELAGIDDEDRRARSAHFFAETLPLPELIPSHEKLLVDGEGNVWMRRYRLPWEVERRWDVIDPAGRWLGTVATPDDFGVYQIVADRLVGLHLDERGVMRVRVHRIHKS